MGWALCRCVPWEEDVTFCLCPIHHGSDELPEEGGEFCAGLPHPQPEVCDHLVIPTASSVQLPCGFPDELLQAPLIGRVDVLIVGVQFEGALGPLLSYLIQATQYLVPLRLGEQSCLLQAPAVGLAALHVYFP